MIKGDQKVAAPRRGELMGGAEDGEGKMREFSIFASHIHKHFRRIINVQCAVVWMYNSMGKCIWVTLNTSDEPMESTRWLAKAKYETNGGGRRGGGKADNKTLRILFFIFRQTSHTLRRCLFIVNYAFRSVLVVNILLYEILLIRLMDDNHVYVHISQSVLCEQQVMSALCVLSQTAALTMFADVSEQ